MLYSLQGDSDAKQKATNTGNATRIRDTDSPKGRGSRGSREGNETNQAINSPSPPEEVESQTVHERPHGDYISKHTHLGSLEDA
jgi:hypothetical protein